MVPHSESETWFSDTRANSKTNLHNWSGHIPKEDSFDKVLIFHTSCQAFDQQSNQIARLLQEKGRPHCIGY